MAQAGDRSGGWIRSAVAGFLFVVTAAAVQGQVELVSRVHPLRLSDTASSVSSVSFRPAVSADGRYVAFLSRATNLVAEQNEPTFGIVDVFLHDRVTGATTLVSHSADAPATSANRDSIVFAMSADGRYVAFVTEATDVVEDWNGISGQRRLFLYDRVSGATTLVSSSNDVDASGVEEVALSSDGRYLAFISTAPDLVPGQNDSTHNSDAFLYDRVTRQTRLVSHASGSVVTSGDRGARRLGISADGRHVSFGSDSTNLGGPGWVNGGVYLYDRISGTVTPVAPGETPSISADGRTVAFFSSAPDLVSGQVERNNSFDLFLYDRESRTFLLASHASGLPTTTGNERTETFYPPAISADGRFTAFISRATDLVPGQSGPSGPAVFLYDRVSGAIALVSRSSSSPTVRGSGFVEAPVISADGRSVAFVSTAQDMVSGQIDVSERDVFLFDRLSGTVRLISSAAHSATTTGNASSFSPAISASGGFVAFQSDADNLVDGFDDLNENQDVFLHEVASASTVAVTVHAPGMPSLTPAASSAAHGVSADGRSVLFVSKARNLVRGQIDANRAEDVFVYDRTTRTSTLVSRSTASPAATGNGESIHPVLSADGRYVAFQSKATNLMAGVSDPTGSPDVFLHDRVSGTTTLVSRSATASATGNRPSILPAISADGRYVAFDSQADDLVPGLTDRNGAAGDVFLYDRENGSTILVSRSSAGAAVTGNEFSTLPVLSADGRYVAFLSQATDLVPGQIDHPDTETFDIFLFDRVTGATVLVTRTVSSAVTTGGADHDQPFSISADGRFVAFSSSSQLTADAPSGGHNVYLFDRVTGTRTLVSRPEDQARSNNPVLSADGRFVAFVSNAEDMIPDAFNYDGGDEVYLFDRISGATHWVSRPVKGPIPPDSDRSDDPTISADGRFIAFYHSSPTVIPGQAGFPGNVFLYDRISGSKILVSRSPASPVTGAGGSSPLLSANGQAVVFQSLSPFLVEGDFNLQTDVFLFTQPSGPVSVPACTLFDSRRRQDRPALRSGVRRSVKAHGACSVPARAKSVVVKVTAVNPTGKGNIRLYPGDSTTASAGILRFERGKTRSGVFTIPLAANGTGTFAILPQVAGNGTVHVAVEVSGYVE